MSDDRRFGRDVPHASPRAHCAGGDTREQLLNQIEGYIGGLVVAPLAHAPDKPSPAQDL
jgi:hypothetical protein